MPKFLLVKGQAIGIICVAGAKEAIETRLLGDHFTAQLAIGEYFIPDDVDLLNLGFGTFIDLKHDINPVLVQLNHLGFDAGSKTALALVQLDNASHIGPHFRAREYLTRSQPDFRPDGIILDPFIAFQQNPVDHRVLDNINDDGAGIIADADILEQFGLEQVFERLVSRFLCISLANPQFHVGEDGAGLEPLRAIDNNRPNCVVGRQTRLNRGRFLRVHRHRNPCQNSTTQQYGQEPFFMLHRQTRFHA